MLLPRNSDPRDQLDITRLVADVIDSYEIVELVRNASCIVGIHPDQATEAILQLSLRLNKPFAVVPCCVYSNMFPDRRM